MITRFKNARANLLARKARGWLLLLGFSALVIISTFIVSNFIRSRPPSLADLETGGLNRASDFKISVYQGEQVLGGKEIEFSQLLAQGKPLVLNFWAGLCPPCRAEMPDLESVHQQYKGRAIIFGLDVGPFVGLGTREDGKALLREIKVTYPVGTTFDADVVRGYKLLGMPTTAFIKPNGEIQRMWPGLLTKAKLTELVEELLAASARPN